MLQIGLCDDDGEALETTEEQIIRHFRQTGVDVRFDSFSDPTVFWAVVSEKLYAYDLFILDCVMPQLDGHELTQRIRRGRPDALIILLTCHTEYAVAGYEWEIFRFVPKWEPQRLLDAVTSAFDRVRRDEGRCFYYESPRERYRIPYREILSIVKDKEGKNSTIFTRTMGPIRLRLSLAEVYQGLDHDVFLYLERAVIVNSTQVTAVKPGDNYYSDIHLTDGSKVQASKRRTKELIHRLNNIWGIGE